MASNNTRLGKCTNFQNGCTTADSNKTVEISILEDFECPECGKELSEVQKKPSSSMGLIIAIAAFVVVAGLGAGSYFMKFPAALYGGGTEATTGGDKESGGKTGHGTIKLSYGSYTGDLKNGEASGVGTMTYSTRTLISQYDRKKRYAEAGQYIVGTWYNNKLDMGKLFNSDGTLVEIVQIGRAQ